MLLSVRHKHMLVSLRNLSCDFFHCFKLTHWTFIASVYIFGLPIKQVIVLVNVYLNTLYDTEHKICSHKWFQKYFQ